MTGETHNTVDGAARIENLTQAHTIERYTQVTINAPGSGAPEPAVPRHFGPVPRHWIGHERLEHAVLRPLRARADAAQRDLVALTGLWGAGRTTLASRVAIRLAADDRNTAVVALDLDRSRAHDVCDQEKALEHLLGSFGVTGEWLPLTLEDRADRFREIAEKRRLILLLDNVRYGSEIRHLLPVVGDSVVMMVSQKRLRDLDPADRPDIQVTVDPLPEEAALELLAAPLDAEDTRLAGEPEAARQLVRLCGGLPVLLHTVKFCLAEEHRHTVAQLADRMTRQWTEDGVPGAEVVWNEGYAALSAPARRLYRLLGVAPALELPQEAVLALFGEEAEAGLCALEKLENAGLLQSYPDGRVRMYDHLRAHALRRARADAEQDGTAGLAAMDEEAKAGRRRLVGWYVRQAQRASQSAGGPRLTIAEMRDARPGDTDVTFGSEAAAHAWLAAQRPVLHACVRIACEDGAIEAATSAAPRDGQPSDGADGDAYALCEPLFTDHLDHPHASGTAEVFLLGLASALRRENLMAVVRLRCILARVYWDHEEFAAADQEAGAAVAAARLVGSADAGSDDLRDKRRKLYASALEFRARAQAVQGHWEQAVPDYEASLRIHEEIRNPYGAMLLTYLLGEAAHGLGRTEQADALLTTAHTQAKEQDRVRMTARTGFALGHVKRAAGRFDEAAALYASSLTAARERHATFDEFRVLEALEALADDRGDEAAAASYRAQAEEVRRRGTGLAEGAGSDGE